MLVKFDICVGPFAVKPFDPLGENPLARGMFTGVVFCTKALRIIALRSERRLDNEKHIVTNPHKRQAQTTPTTMIIRSVGEKAAAGPLEGGDGGVEYELIEVVTAFE